MRAADGAAQKWKWGKPAYSVGVWNAQSHPRLLWGLSARKSLPGASLSQ